MSRARWLTLGCLCFALVSGPADRTRASLVISSGLGTTHAGNLVANGSFETGAP
jgi:hypothetical protein